MSRHVVTLRRILLVVGLVFSTASPCLADNPAPPKKLTTVDSITEYALPNGLKVLLFRDKSAATVTVNLTVLVGSRHEGYGEYGMAHLLEHMQFKGTPKFPHVPQILKQHGADFNATTSFDRTTYFETLPASDANLEFALDLEADRLTHSFIRAQDLASEMTVVRNEFEMGENDPEQILSQRMNSAAYLWHNYGHSIIGNRADIERVPITRLQTFYRKHYRPDNALLVVGGKFQPDHALAAIRKYFGVLKRPATAIERTYTDEPPQDGERRVTLRRVGKVPVVGVVYHIPAAADADYPACDLLTSILTSEPSGRLYRSLVEGKKATSVGGSAAARHDPGILEVLVQVDQAHDPNRVLEDLVHGLENPDQHHFTDAEVERARAEWLRGRELLVANSRRMTLQLGEWQARGDWRLFFIERDRIQKVTAADVDRVASRYLVRSNRTSGIFVPTAQPERADIPPMPDIAKLVEGFHGTKTVSAGEAFDPTPANIERHVHRPQLPGGLKMALLPRKTRGQTVVVYLTLHYGGPTALKGHTSATQFLTSLMARGTRQHTYQQIQERLDELGANLSTGGLTGRATFTVVAKRDKLPEVLKLLGEVLREPAFPTDQLDILKRETRDRLKRGLTEPMALAQRTLQRRLSPYPKDDVRYVPTVQESIDRLDKVTLAEVRALYTEQFGAQDGELAVVGDFDPVAVTRQFQEMLGNWKAHVPYQRIERMAHPDVKGVTDNIDTPGKANAVYLAGETLALRDTNPAYPALEIGNYILGGGPLSSRLADRVRQKEGLSYAIGTHFLAAAREPFAEWMIFAITNPKNIDRLDQSIHQELTRLVEQGVSADEVSEAIRSYLENAKVQRANDTGLAILLADELHNHRTMHYDEELENRIRKLTPAEINAALRKYLDPKRIIVIRAGDFKK